MAIGKVLTGRTCNLLPIEENHAPFTLEIRNDESLTEFIPTIEISLENQTEWIRKQRLKEGDYFYLIQDKSGKNLGTASVYDVDGTNDICEFGRFISYGNAFENVETAMLLLGFAFCTLHINKVMLNNDERNKKIISFWKRFGAKFEGNHAYETWTAARYLLTKEDYEKSSEKIRALLKGRD